MKKVFLFILIAKLLNFTGSVLVANTVVGTLPGELSVNQGGSATYSIPISLPGGTGGMQPDLSLVYSSMAGNGMLGVGWSLEGLSQISRAPHTMPQDGKIQGIQFIADNYALDGQRLLRVGSSSEYRTEIEGFSKVTRHGTAGNGPQRWEVRTKDGLLMKYGSGSNSRIIRDGGSEVMTWLLDRIEDSSGNYITITYRPADYAGTRSHVVRKISYTGNSAAYLEPYYSVQFVYENRSDSSSGYVHGTPFSLTKRLKTIYVVEGTANIGSNPDYIRRYTLNYGSSAANGFSLLKSVELSGKDGSQVLTLNPTEFEYLEEPMGEFERSTMGNDLGDWYHGGGTEEVAPQFHMVDLNGDGNFELAKVYVEWVNSTQRYQVRMRRYQENNGSWSEVSGSYLSLTGAHSGFSAINDLRIARPQVHIADFTGNGKSDMLLVHHYNLDSGGAHRRLMRLFLSNGTNFVLKKQLHENDRSYAGDDAAEQVHVGDLSGNGLPDIIRVTVHKNGDIEAVIQNVVESSIQHSTISAVIANFDWTSPAEILNKHPIHNNLAADAHNHVRTFITDFNGDGLPDLVAHYKSTASPALSEVMIFPGRHFEGGPEFSRWGNDKVHVTGIGGWAVHNELRPFDVNGNGLMDLVYRVYWNQTPDDVWFKVLSSDGVGFHETANFRVGPGDYSSPSHVKGAWDDDAQWLITDVNGNGLGDLVYFHHQRMQPVQAGSGSMMSRYQIPQFNIIEQPESGFGFSSGNSNDPATFILDDIVSIGFSYSEPSWSHISHRKDLIIHQDRETGKPVVYGFLPEGLTQGDKVKCIQWTPESYTPSNLLVQATNGLGSVTRVDYDFLLGDSGLYDSEALNNFENPTPLHYPLVDIAPPMWVVSGVGRDTGSDDPEELYWTSYTYGSARAHLRGHGFLGFGTFISYDLNTNIAQYQLLEQSWPINGMVRASMTYHYLDPDPVNPEVILLSRVDNKNTFSYVDLPYTSNSVDSVFLMTLEGRERLWEFREQGDSAGIGGSPDLLPNPHSDIVSQTWFDLMDWNQPVPIPATTPTPQDNRWIQWGNIRQIHVNYGEGFEQTTRNSYYNVDANKWHLGRLRATQVKSIAPQIPDIDPEPDDDISLSTSAWEYHPDTGLISKEMIEPQTIPGGSLFTGITRNFTFAKFLPQETIYTRDVFGNVTSTEVKDVYHNKTRISTSFGFTAGNNNGRYPAYVENALGHRESYVYNHRLGKQRKLTGPNGHDTEWEFDALGRTIKEIRPDGTETVTSWHWDNSINLPALSWADHSYVQRSVYRVDVQSTGSPLVSTYYDRLGREIRKSTQTFISEGQSLQTVRTVTHYNLLGQVIAVSEPSPSGLPASGWTTSFFDPLGRLEFAIYPDESFTWFGYAGRWQGEHRIREKDPGEMENPQDQFEDQSTWRAVNARGDTIWIQDSMDNEMHHAYNAAGHLRRTTVPGGIETVFIYDKRGNKVGMKDPSMGDWAYQYNAFGELVQQTDGKNQTTLLSYDELGRMTKRVRPDSVATWLYWESVGIQTQPENGWVGALRQETYTHNAQHGQSAYTNRRSYYYDSLGRPMLSLHNVEDKWYYEYTRYDSLGRPLQVDYFWRPKGLENASQSPAYAWHTYGQIFTYDSHDLGFVVEVSDTQGHVWWKDPVYDYRGRVTQHRNGNTFGVSVGELVTHEYDDNTQTLTRVRSHAQGSYFHDMKFDFNAFGNLTQRTEYRHIGGSFNLSEQFEYDALNRLKKVTGSSGTVNMVYDALGRITSKTGVGTYNYSSSSPYRLSTAGSTVSLTQYDANGNITRQDRSGSSVYFNWTSFNKPARIYSGGVNNTHSLFRYDASGNRVSHTIRENNQNQRRTLYLSGVFEQHEKPNGSSGWEVDFTRIKITAPTGVVGTYDHKADAVNAAGNTRSFFHYDHLGSIVAVTGSWMDGELSPYHPNNNLVQRFSYDAWGKERNANTWTGNPPNQSVDEVFDRGFTGHEMLRHLGIVHMNGRIYDPLLGRFFSADPFVQSPGNLQNYNRYGYVYNNPLSYTDPSGYFFKKLFRSIGNFVKKYWQTIVTVALYATGFGALALAFQSVMAYQQGGWKGVFMTLGTAALTIGIGMGLEGVQSLASVEGFMHEMARGVAHGMVQGVGAEMMGGEFSGGFLAGFTGSLGGSVMGQAGFKNTFNNRTNRVVASAIVGGTFSVVGGGKFANGAISGAMVQALNHENHDGEAHGEEVKLSFETIGEPVISEGGTTATWEIRWKLEGDNKALNGLIVQEIEIGIVGVDDLQYHFVEAWNVRNGRIDHKGSDTFRISVDLSKVPSGASGVTFIEGRATFYSGMTFRNSGQNWKRNLNHPTGGLRYFDVTSRYVTAPQVHRRMSTQVTSSGLSHLRTSQYE